MNGDTRLESLLGEALKRRGWTISAAESCTGGLVLSRLTDVPGSSAYVVGGAVTYSNALKRDLLGVSDFVLERFGAVSSQTAEAMARGALDLFQTDLALSITGIAGPDGGTPEKPVGLTFIAIAGADGIIADGVIVRRYVWSGDRLANKAASADAALRLALEIAGINP
jgi:PncC family amidohydrolase